jgi:hypothetical protein
MAGAPRISTSAVSPAASGRERADRAEGDVDLVAALAHEIIGELAHRRRHRARAKHLDLGHSA